MKKRITGLFLAMLLVMTAVLPAYAGTWSGVRKTLGYSNGIRTWELTDKYYTEGKDATATGTSLQVKAGGEATYFFYVPFHAMSVDFSFAEAGADFTLYDVMADKSYAVQTDGTAATVEFAPTLYIGEHHFIIKADKDKNINISKMVFNKNKIWISEQPYELVNMSNEDWAVATAIILKEDSSMIMVNGSRRYIDFDNLTLTPRYFNGSLHLPVHALARMLDAYYEELPDKEYVLIRKMDKEFLFAPDICYRQHFGKDREPIDSMVVYADGYAWLPVRPIAEYFGEYVGYKDGYVAMDDNRFHVNDILNAGSVHSFVVNKFIPFVVTPDKGYTGRTYYVATNAPNASDENVGDEAAPWKTLTHAGQVVQAGDTVIVKEGTYREVLTCKNNGEPGKPIRFLAAEGEEVVISAAETVSDFMPYKDGILAAHLGYDLGPTRNQVFYKGSTIREARHPNGPDLEFTEQAGLSDNWPTEGDIHVYQPADMNHAVSDTVLNQDEPDYWKGGYLMGVWCTAYGVQSAEIVASEKGRLTLSGYSLEFWSTQHDNASHYNFSWAYISGHMNCMDIPGEWIVRGDTLFIIPPEGETAETLELEVKKRQLVIDLANNKHVNVEGFTTIGGGAKYNNAEMCRIDDCHIKYNNHFLVSADPSGGFLEDGVRTNPNGTPFRGEMGFLIGGTDNVLTNCYFDEAAGPGAYVTGLHTYMENLLVEECGYAGGYNGGLLINKQPAIQNDYEPSGGYYLYQSTCADAGRSVFMRSGGERDPNNRTTNVLPGHNAYNEYYGSMLTSLDTGIIYTYMLDHGNDRLKTQLHNNICYNHYTGKDAFSFGIYHDGGTQNIDTYENIVFKGDESINIGDDVHMAYAELALADCDAWNNIEEMSRGGDVVVPGGRDGLKPEHYPYNKPFDAGTKMFRDPYTVNYDLRHTDLTQKLDPNNMLLQKDEYILASTAKAGEGAWIDEAGRGRFTKDGDWLCFEDVNFGEGANVISIGYQADPYNVNGEDMEIIIDDLNSEDVFDFYGSITAESRQENIGEVRHRRLYAYSGYHDVYIRAKDYFALKITGIRVWADDLEASARLKGTIYAGTFDQRDYKVVVEGFASVPSTTQATSDPRYIFEGDGSSIGNTWDGSVYKFKNIKVEEGTDTFGMVTASGGVYGGQIITLHINDPSSEPVATIDCTTFSDWGNYSEDTAKLTTPLKAGVYDVYIKFTDPVKYLGPDRWNGKSCNWKSWSLRKGGGVGIIAGRTEPRK